MVLIEIVNFFIAVAESLLSFCLNFYIVIFYMKRLRDRVRLNPSSLIQLVMGATNISMRVMMLGCSIALFYPIYHVTRFYHSLLVIVPFHLNFSYWLIAWLCAYYCTTITRHRLFIWMKRILVSFLPHLLFISAVVSFILTVQSVWYLNVSISHDNSTLSYILPNFIFSISDLSVVLIICLCSCLPFLMIFGSLMVTMSSLFRHIKKVKKNDSGFAPPNLQAHVSAVRTMILFLLLSVLINVAEMVKIMAPSFFGGYLQLIIWLMVAIFPLAEAAIIIQSSRKLKKMVPQMFCGGRFMEDQN